MNTSNSYLFPLYSYCLFGEWLWCQHSVSYDALPSYLITFDIFDKNNDVFLSTGRIAEIIQDRLPIVPIVREWNVRLSHILYFC